jgi:ribosomal protein S18 acetylase RimI-like enzyme
MTSTLAATTIRWAEIADYAEIVEILRDCFPDDHWTIDDIYEFVRGKNNVIKCLCDHDDVVYAVLFYNVSPDQCRVLQIAVVPEQRRQGFAKQLLQSIYNLVQRQRFVTQVPESNVAATLLFQQMGYVFDPKRERERDPETGDDYYEFVKTKLVKRLRTED